MTEAFMVGDRVRITNGLYRNRIGTVVDVAIGGWYDVTVEAVEVYVERHPTIMYKAYELERIEDVEMDRQTTTDDAVSASVAGQSDDVQRGAGTADQSPAPFAETTAAAVVAENQLAALIAEQLDLGMSVKFSPSGEEIEVDIDPYDDDDGDAEGRYGFGLTALDAMRDALDVEREMRGMFS